MLCTIPLGYIKHATVRRPDESAGINGPQPTQDSE